MKKVILITIVMISFFTFTGCKKEEIFINTDDITTNTILIKRDGSIYATIVEDFDKSYYNLTELNEFVAEEVNAYNQKIGSTEVTIEELELKNSKAILLLKYSKMAHYSAFNDVPAAYYSASTENVALELPNQYVNAKRDTVVDKSTAMKNGKNKVLVLYEPYEIIVEGDIKFYSSNATLLENNIVKSNSDNMTVVIYRP
ncbi:MAG: hypothetical protein GX321_09985 [Clostridiales bacterium]|nr:hypothetical protein [Clostridiales bacterium]